MKSEQIKEITDRATEQLVAALKAGHSEALTGLSQGHRALPPLQSLQRDAHRFTESNDMLLYLAGINEHAVLRIVGSKRWSVAHFLRTIQYLFEYGARFLAT